MALTKLNSQMLEIPVSVTTLSATDLTSTTLNANTINSINVNSVNANATYTTTSNIILPPDNSGIIYNKINLFGDLTITGSITALSGFDVIVTSTTSTSSLSVDNSGVGPALFVKQSANIDGIANFIGGDNTEVLKINNTIPFTGQPAVRILNVGINNTFVVGNSANPDSTALVVTSAGRVGIGTLTPTSTLQVSGTLIANNLQGNLTGTFSGNLTSLNSNITTVTAFNIFNTNLTSASINTNSIKADVLNIDTLVLGTTSNATFDDVSHLSIIGRSFKSVFNKIQNTNTATAVSGSTDLALYNGIDNYIDLGICSNTYNGNQYGPTFNIVNANDGYLYNTNGNFAIGAINSDKDVLIFAGGTLSGTFVESGNEVARFSSTGNVGFGTRTPNQRLTVVGDISATNNISTNSITPAEQQLTVTGNVNTTGFISTSGLQVRDNIYYTNTTMGSAKLDGRGTLINTSAITNNSRVFLTTQIPLGTVGSLYVAERTSTVSFKVSSTQVGDTSIFAWMIVEPTI